MEHLIFFSYVLLFSTGFAGVASLAYLRFRLRRPSLPFFLAIQVSYLTGLGLQAAYYYLRNVVDPGSLSGSERLQNILVLGSGFAIAILYWCALLTLRAEGWHRLGRCRPAFLSPAAGFSVLASAVLGSVGLVAWALGVRLRLPPLVSYLPAVLTIMLCGLLFALIRFADEPPAFRLLVRGYGCCLLAFVPLTFLEMSLEKAVALSLKPISLDFLFFFLWNCVSIAAAAASLAPGRNFPPAPLLDCVPEAVAERFGLSPREREMILLIARGLPNKGIAAELGISPSTVRTHIYNLFQKVGARSRIELLALLKEES
jgi:DNA-binding CsgD family transcriptional regulator